MKCNSLQISKSNKATLKSATQLHIQLVPTWYQSLVRDRCAHIIALSRTPSNDILNLVCEIAASFALPR